MPRGKRTTHRAPTTRATRKTTRKRRTATAVSAPKFLDQHPTVHFHADYSEIEQAIERLHELLGLLDEIGGNRSRASATRRRSTRGKKATGSTRARKTTRARSTRRKATAVRRPATRRRRARKTTMSTSEYAAREGLSHS